MKPLTDEEVQALVRVVHESTPVADSHDRAIFRAGMMKAVEIAGDAGSYMASRDHGQGVMDAMNAIIAAAGGQHG